MKVWIHTMLVALACSAAVGHAAPTKDFCGKVIKMSPVWADDAFISSVTLFNAKAKDLSKTDYNERYVALKHGLLEKLAETLRQDLLALYESYEDNNRSIKDANIKVCLKKAKFYTRKHQGRVYRFSKEAQELSVTVDGETPRVDPRLNVEIPAGGLSVAYAIAQQLGESISAKCVYGTNAKDGSQSFSIPFGSQGYTCGDEHYGVMVYFDADGRFLRAELIDS